MKLENALQSNVPKWEGEDHGVGDFANLAVSEGRSLEAIGLLHGLDPPKILQ